jgi:hypothetical protein
VKGRLEKCETIRHDERTCNSLRNSRSDENDDVRRDTARDRANRKTYKPEAEYSRARITIAESAAEENQRAQGEEKSVQHPLQARHCKSEVATNRRKRNGYNRALEKHCAGSENRGSEYPIRAWGC